MRRFSSWIAAVVMSSLLGGCRTLDREAVPAAPVAGTLQTRNNAASLLYDLFEDERHLSKLLLIKRETDELDRLVKSISSFAAAGVKELKQMNKAEPSLDLNALALPSGEVATREAISHTKANSLLHSSGTTFEFRLLLTQVEALNYGAHLARVAAAHEPDLERSRRFRELGADMQRFYEQAVRLLQARATSASSQ